MGYLKFSFGFQTHLVDLVAVVQVLLLDVLDLQLSVRFDLVYDLSVVFLDRVDLAHQVLDLGVFYFDLLVVLVLFTLASSGMVSLQLVQSVLVS